MKIEINDAENYEINFPTRVDKQGFFAIANRIERIRKLMDKDDFSNLTNLSDSEIPQDKDTGGTSGIKRHRRSRIIRSHLNSKEKVVELLKLVYHGTHEQRQKVCDIYDIDWDNHVGKAMFYQKERWHVNPSEVGMKRFPKKGEKSENLKVPNYNPKFNFKVFTKD